ERVAQHRRNACCWQVLGDRPRSFSFAAVVDEAARYAAALRELGATRGARVVLQVEKSPEALLVYLACLRLGAVFVPLNPAYTLRELDDFVADAEPQVIIAAPARAAELQARDVPRGCALATLDTSGGGSLPQLARDVTPEASVTPVGADAPAAIVYTSGTTGRPKGAVLTHRNLSVNARALVQLWRFRTDDVLLHILPVYHVHGLFVATHCALLAGCRTLLMPSFAVDAVIAALPAATVLMGVPTHYVRLLGHPRFDRDLCANIRVFISGSAPLLPATFAAVERRTGRRILERYGMSEAGIIASNPYDGARVPGTVGYALPQVELRICDAAGVELPCGAVGVLEIRGPNVSPGYWRRERNADEFRTDGWFVTGDLATIAEDGRLTLVGRARELIITGGLNVYPKEIEYLLDGLPGVRESAVIGVPHPDFGEAVIAVVASDDPQALQEAALADALRGRLAAFKVPKRFFCVAELQRNAMGKVQKPILREQYRNCFGG
ncbi:MAG: AMP-binding protein, partial [Steroidobacteraceae bacterium]|nr:AMP-binding protein [Steroidobacteraceae bacterium]